MNNSFSLAGITLENFQQNFQPYQFGTGFNLSLLGASGGGNSGGTGGGGARFNFGGLSPFQLGALSPAAGGPQGNSGGGGGAGACVNKLLNLGGSVGGSANLCNNDQ